MDVKPAAPAVKFLQPLSTKKEEKTNKIVAKPFKTEQIGDQVESEKLGEEPASFSDFLLPVITKVDSSKLLRIQTKNEKEPVFDLK